MKQIDLEQPLSREERDYLLSRGLENQVYVNDVAFGRPGEPGELDPDGDSFSAVEAERVVAEENRQWVESLTVEELRGELEARDLPRSGNRAELAERLLAALDEEE